MALIYVIASDHTQLVQAPTLIDDVTGQMTALVLVPTVAGHLVSKQWVDDTFLAMAPRNLPGTMRGTYVTVEDVAALDDQIVLLADQADLVAVQNNAVKLAGSTVTGPITYDAGPLNDDELINKAFVDDISDLIPGNILTQPVADTRYLSKSGGTLTGPLVLPSTDPTETMQIVKKSYVDTMMPSLANTLRRAGGNMSGALIQSRLPIKPNEIATKQYVDFWNDYLDAPIQPYIASGAILGVLHPFLGQIDSTGKLLSIRNAVKGHAEFDLTRIGDPLTLVDGAFWTPTATSALGFANPVSILNYDILIGANGINFNGAQTIARAIMADGSFINYRFELSGNRLNIGGAFYYTDATGTVHSVTTSKRGTPQDFAIHTHQFFRNAGVDQTGSRIWDYRTDNKDVNGNPGLGLDDVGIKTFGLSSTGVPLNGNIGPIVIVARAAVDNVEALEAAQAWITGLQNLIPL